uniref:(northern house mosquito) hypothetical protein n=1 Tax=Culex pipiens TaxID=7175 RepID=A0A8D8F147_CULPI
MARQFSGAPPCCSSRLSGWGFPMPPFSDQSFWLRTVDGASFCSSAVQNQPFTTTGCRSGRSQPLKSQSRPLVQMYFCLPSTILCLIHSFSGLVSTDTLSMHRCRQKLRASSQSFSTPARVGSRHEKKYPLPSGARSWTIRLAHSCGFGASRTRPFGNWATVRPTRAASTTNCFILVH